MVNAYWEALEFEVPPLEAQMSWRRCVDTYLDPPDNIRSWADGQILESSIYRVQARSVVILLARTSETRLRLVRSRSSDTAPFSNRQPASRRSRASLDAARSASASSFLAVRSRAS
jgi:hypothetical protein